MLSLLDAPFDLCMSDGWQRVADVGGDHNCNVLVDDAERRARLERADDPDLDDAALLELSHETDCLVLDAVRRKRAESGLANTGCDDVDCLVRDAERRAAAERTV